MRTMKDGNQGVCWKHSRVSILAITEEWADEKIEEMTNRALFIVDLACDNEEY